MTAELTMNVFIEPKSAMTKLNNEPNFWFPLFLTIALSVIAVVIYFSLVDYEWLSDYMLNSLAKPDGVAADNEAVPQISKDIMMWMSITGIVIGIPIVRILESTYYHLVGKITGVERSFKYWLAVSCWSAIPLLLVIMVSVGMLVAHSNGQVSQEQLNVFSLNELFFNVNPSDKWYSLLSSITILHPWVWWLVAYAVRLTSGRSWQYCLLFSTLPWIVIYGIWGLFVLL